MPFFISFLSGVIVFYSFQYFPFSTVFISLLSSVYLFFQKRFFIIFILLSGIAFALIRYEPVKDIQYKKDKVIEITKIEKQLKTLQINDDLLKKFNFSKYRSKLLKCLHNLPGREKKHLVRLVLSPEDNGKIIVTRKIHADIQAGGGNPKEYAYKYNEEEHWRETGGMTLNFSFKLKMEKIIGAINYLKEKGYVNVKLNQAGFYILHPYPEFYTLYGNEYVAANNDSLVLKIKGYQTSYLFSGDVEEEAEENIQHLGGWLKSNVLKVPHHGGKTSVYKPFLKNVSPEVAIISVGRDNTFGHPHQEMLDALDAAQIFRTDIDGAIKIKETSNGFKIKTYRDFQFERAKTLSVEFKNMKRLFESW